MMAPVCLFDIPGAFRTSFEPARSHYVLCIYSYDYNDSQTDVCCGGL